MTIRAPGSKDDKPLRARPVAIERLLAAFGAWARDRGWQPRPGVGRAARASSPDDERWPDRVAIRERTVALLDGTRVRLRAIRPDDKERLRVAFQHLSPRSVYQRFLHPVTALTPDALRDLTEPDFRRHVALVLSVQQDGVERLIAVARYVRVAPDSRRAELAITVADDDQRRGAGMLLLHELVDLARRDGIRELVAHVLEDNEAMLTLIRRSGLSLRESRADGVVTVRARLDNAMRWT